MPDIDFLANKQPADDQQGKKESSKKEKIVWSEPEKNKPISKGSDFFPLPFLGKKEEPKPAAKPAAAPEPKPTANRNRIIESRQEILRLIKHHESLKSALKEKANQSRWAAFFEKFKKQPSQKEALANYHEVLQKEKARPARPPVENLTPPIQPPAMAQLNQAPLKQPQPIRPITKPTVTASSLVKEKKPLPPAPKKFKDSLWAKFIKFIRQKLLSQNQSKIRPAQINLVQAVKPAKPKVTRTPLPPRSTTSSVKPPEPAKPIVNPMLKVPPPPAEERSSQQTEPIKIGQTGPKVLATNLIRGEIVNFFDWHKKAVTLTQAIFIPLVLIGLTYLGLIYYQKQNQARMMELIKKSDELTMAVKQEEVGLSEIIGFQARLKVVSQVFSQHIYWTNFFKFLEDNTIKNVYYAGFDGDLSGNYSLGAMAKKFSDIARQFDVLRNNQKIIEVKTIGGEAVPGNDRQPAGIKFTLDVSILKNIFTE